MKQKKRITAFLLAGVMLFSSVPVQTFAEKTANTTEQTESAPDAGLCEHHPKHTKECGYEEEIPGTPCTHEHTEDCYKLVEKCIHKHTEECYPEEEEEDFEEVGTSSNARYKKKRRRPTECMHECSEEEGCITMKLNCGHDKGRHTEECGYTKTIPEKPCTFVCEICEDTTVEWPDAPIWSDGPEAMGDGKIFGEIYGLPMQGMSAGELAKIQTLSLDQRIEADPAKEIPTEGDNSELSGPITFIYINGEAYTGGDVNVTEGDDFSYNVNWSPNLPDGKMTWDEGSWFEVELFQVPGLNLASAKNVPLSINGIKVGEYSLTYQKTDDPDTNGVMTYKVVFNRYIQMFDPDTIAAQVRGSGRFTDSEADGPIKNGSDTGTITIDPRPTLPPINPGAGGTGWKPPEPPKFDDRPFPFGKGVKWNSSKDENSVPQIEWRVVFLDQMQKLLREFWENQQDENAPDWKFPESTGYVIIEDTLDVNQRFYSPPGADEGKYKGAPFFLEIPVMVPGTGHTLNGNGNAGNDDYDGAGEIYSLYKGDQFKEIPGDKANTLEEISAIHEEVRKTPLTWTVTTHPETRQQTLLINAGKLGTEDPTQGLIWDNVNTAQKWPKQGILNEIKYCEDKLNALEAGNDSPIALMNQRAEKLLNLLKQAANLSQNSDPDVKADMEAKIAAWEADYKAWINDPLVGFLEPLAKKDEITQQWELIRPLPQTKLIEDLKDCVANSKGDTLEKTTQYADYKKSLDNIQADQRIYLENRLQYKTGWNTAKKYYQEALDFYNHKGIYGFIVKIRTESINTSMSSYSNTVRVELDGKTWEATDESEIKFAGGIIGSYSLGDIVVQKADKFYDKTENTTQDNILNVEKDKAGLAGAKFEVYCGDINGQEPAITSENLAHFLDKEASINGTTYRYAHTGDDHSTGMIGETSTLTTDDEGKLAMSGLAQAHPHWLRETTAPEGYYLDSRLTRVDVDKNKVTYELLPNHSRSVLLRKADASSQNPVQGAEFALYKMEGQTEKRVTNFVKKSLNDHDTYWMTSDGSGTANLLTNEEGELCIHGLDPGTYRLQEIKPAPGYKMPKPAPEYEFTLGESLPDGAAGNPNYDMAYHYLINDGKPLVNEPETATLTMTKTGIPDDPADPDPALPGAAFGLFYFFGPESEWKKDPDNEEFWQPLVKERMDDQKYFNTNNKVEKITLGEGGPQWAGETVQAILTDEKGQFTLTDIPVGHYSISELKAPTGYERDLRSFYFTVDDTTAGKDLQLYTAPEEEPKNELKDNTLKNYKNQAQIALVKYDKAEDKPIPEGGLLGGGFQYTDDVLQAASPKGLPEAWYKLFMRRGASTETEGKVKPDPEQLKPENAEIIIQDAPNQDTCIAIGKTDKSGVLKLSEMKDKNGNSVDGLNQEEYYMIEVKAPDGYLLDYKPIYFSINEEVLESENAAAGIKPGLVMMAENEKVQYGLRLKKVDKSTTGTDKEPVGLQGAVFEVTKKDGTTPLYFTGSNGSYQVVSKSTQGAMSLIATGENGKLEIVGLEKGTEYTFEEKVPPRGYKPLAKPITIQTANSVQGGALDEDSKILYQKDEVQVENERLLGKVKLHKQAAETNEPLEDAEFTLYKTVVTVIQPGEPGYDPDFPGGTRSEDVPVQTRRTDKNGDITFENLEWHDFYYIQETKAPEGYLLDQTKRQFSIDENAFTADGQAIPIEYPGIVNSRGTLGQARLTKVDADDHSKKLPDAHFYLFKHIGYEVSGKEIWVGYGQGMYITDQNGEINFLLPPGDYKLQEMAAPPGYLLEGKEIFFTIEEGTNGQNPPLKIIDEEGSNDGVIVNRQGDTGVLIKKTVEGTNVAIPGVTFQIYWELLGLASGKVVTEDIFFVPDNEKGHYTFVEDKRTPGATNKLVTNSNGEIYVKMPKSVMSGPSIWPDDDLYTLSFVYEEVAVPEGVQPPPSDQPIKGSFIPIDEIYLLIPVTNKIKEDSQTPLSIAIQKTDGKSKLGLEGAKFELSTMLGRDEIFMARGISDAQGNVVFDRQAVEGEPPLETPIKLALGGTYYIRELEAPKGYVLDETVHEITIDEKHFDENFKFIPIVLSVPNYKVRGSVRLTKAEEGNTAKKLPGAEFELLRKAEDTAAVDEEWEHYGEERYVTDKNGELFIPDLPVGSYRLIERAAPLGYLLGSPPAEVEFEIQEGDHNRVIDLGEITNKVDPNPVRDVTVKKVAAEDTSKALAGARFELYERKEDGNYYLRQKQVYVTDSRGEFTIEKLPVGSYALKEIEAPAGYDIPDQDMTYFAVQVSDRAVYLQIENAVSAGDTEGTLTVKKVWEDNNSSARPNSVKVQLSRNGQPYEEPVELNQANGWQYTWESLDQDYVWAADEVGVPTGYKKSLNRKGNVWIITNRAEFMDRPSRPSGGSGGGSGGGGWGTVPGDYRPAGPGSSGEFGGPGVPTVPGEPTLPQFPIPVNPDSPSGSNIFWDVPDVPGPQKPGIPTDSIPQTGDESQLSLWLTLMFLSALGFGLVWFKTRSKGEKNKGKKQG